MRDGWKVLRLGDDAEIKHGFAFPGSEFATDPGYPTVVTPGNFRIGGGFQQTKVKTFSGDVPDGFVFEPGDLIVTMTDLSKTGDTLGYPAFVPGDRTYLHNQRIGKVFLRHRRLVDLRYLALVMQTSAYRAYVLGTASGSTVRHTSPSRILDYKAPFPPIEEQQRIAGVLGALDDLIDSNRRLQEMLAHQRYAVMAHAVSSASDSTTFGEIAELVRVQVSPADVAPGTPYLGLEHFAENASGLLGVGVTDGLDSTKWRFEAGDVLYGKLRPYFRKVVRPNFDGVCSTEIWVLRPKEDVSSEYLEWVASTQEFTDFAMAGSTGTRMPRANWDHVRTFTIAKSAGDDFTRAIAASRVMWEQYWALHQEDEELGRTRDELLPLLLSGLVRVEEVAA